MYLYPGFELGVAVSLERGKMVRGREATPGRIKADRHGKLVNYLFIYPIFTSNIHLYILSTRHGLPTVEMVNIRNSRLLEFENPGTHIPAKNCTLRCVGTRAGNIHS